MEKIIVFNEVRLIVNGLFSLFTNSLVDLKEDLFRQFAVSFIFSLIFVVVHLIFGISFYNIILESSGVQFGLVSIIMIAIFIVLIYVVTYLGSKNIIKEK